MRVDRLILALLLIVLPGAFWPGNTTYEAAKFLVLTLSVGALFLNGAWRIGSGKTLLRPFSSSLGLWLGLLLVIPLSGTMAANVSLVMRTWALTAAWMLVMWLACSRTHQLSDLRWLLRAVVGGAVFTSGYGLAQIHGWVTGPDLALGLPVGISTFGNENQMAGFAAVALWPALALMFLSRNRPQYMSATIAILILMAAVMQAEAMGPKIAVIGSFAVISPCWMLVRIGQSRLVPWVGITIGAVGILATVLVFARILSGDADANLPAVVKHWLTDNNGNIRRTDWLVAWHLVQQNGPSFSGAGNYQVLWPETRAAINALPAYGNLAEHIPVATRAHNDYLQGIAELGAMGVTLFVMIVAQLTNGFRRGWHQIVELGLARVWLFLAGGVVAVGTHALVSFPFHLPAPMMALAVIIGVMAAPVFRPDGFALPTLYWPRWLFVVPALVGLLIGGLGVREYVGDLHEARGEAAYLASDFPTALTELEQAHHMRWWPRMGDLYRGLTLMALNRDEEAAPALMTSLNNRPTYEAMLALAELETDRKDFPTALSHLARVDSCRPKQKFRDQSLYLRGMIYLRQGAYPEARQVFDRLLADVPRYHRGLLAAGYLSVLEGDQSGAREYYARALKMIEEDLLTVQDSGEEVRLKKMRDTARRAVASAR